MRFTRAAKVAAFPLTALILVALVACQGPAGPAGAAGGKGDPGTMGTPGSPGTPGASGISPIVKTDKAAEVILLNRRALEETLGSATAVVDVTGYFRGGKKPLTYTIVKPTDDPGATDDAFDVSVHGATAIFKAVLHPTTGLLTVTAKKPRAAIAVTAKYSDGETVLIKATDADKIAAPTVKLTIKPNRPPRAPEDVNGEPTPLATPLTVGTQNAKDALRDGQHNTTATALVTQPNPVCATFASCVFNVKLQDAGEVVDATLFNATLTRSTEPPNLTDLTAINLIPRDILIIDEDTKGMTFSIVDNDDKLVQASASGNKITIGGVKSTWVGAAHVATLVRIMATDSNRLTVERNIMVHVDGAPTLSKDFHFLSRYELPSDATLVLPAMLESYFVDPDNGNTDLIYTVTSSNHAVARPPLAGTPIAADGNLPMTLGQGTATVTITAMDIRGQTVTAEFVVNVKLAEE